MIKYSEIAHYFRLIFKIYWKIKKIYFKREIICSYRQCIPVKFL